MVPCFFQRIMTRPFICIGDKTSHNGVVVEGSPTTFTHGRAIARVGDRVLCHGSSTVIATGDPTCLIDGRPAARHGDLTTCGATLIASQMVSLD